MKYMKAQRPNTGRIYICICLLVWTSQVIEDFQNTLHCHAKLILRDMSTKSWIYFSVSSQLIMSDSTDKKDIS